jgi:hypothetical protein
MNKLIRLVLIIMVTSLLLMGWFRSQYNDDIRSLAQTRVINATSDLINDAIDLQIETGTIQYDRIVYFEKDLNGRITALKTNMSEVNRLKTSILNIITVMTTNISQESSLIQVMKNSMCASFEMQNDVAFRILRRLIWKKQRYLHL